MPIFTENSTQLSHFQTAYFILNFQNLLEPGLQKTLPELLPVPWLWVETRNVSNARVNPELRLSCHTKVILFCQINSVCCLSNLTVSLTSAAQAQLFTSGEGVRHRKLKVWSTAIASNIIPIGIAHPADWEDSGFLHVSALKASKFTPSSSSFTRLERI